MKKWMKYVKPYWVSFVLGPILMIVEVIGEILMPEFLARIINVGVAAMSWLVLILPARVASSISPARTMRCD